jgi:hypothetical protein
MLNSRESGVTLTEIILAVSLLSFIMLAISGIDVAARRLLRATDRETAVLMDIAPAISHMEKWLALATGDSMDPGINCTGGDWIEFRTDFDYNDNCMYTPEDYTDPNITRVWRKYALDNNELKYYPRRSVPGTFKVLSSKIDNITFTVNPASIRVEVVACYDPSGGCPADDPNNPTIKIESTISPRTHSFN